jgi:hypothetical protein
MNIKLNFLVVLLLGVFQNMNAQVQKLYELSQNKYLGMNVILNEKQDDVYGYCVLYQKDKVEENVLDLELVILDNNLNKVGAASFKQFFFTNGAKDEIPKITQHNLQGNTLYFSVGLSGMFNSMPAIYRKLDLTDFTISDPNIFLNNELQPYDNKNTTAMPGFGSMVISLGTSGYLSYTSAGRGSRGGDLSEVKNEFAVRDLDFKIKWSGVYKSDVSRKITDWNTILSLLQPLHNKDYLVFTSIEVVNKKYVIKYEVYNIQDGSKMRNFKIEDDNYLYTNDKLILKGDTVVSYDFVFEKNKKDEKDESKIIGYSEKIFNLKDGTDSQKILKWDAFKEHLAIDAYGKIDNEFYIHPMTIQTRANGNKLMVFEGFNPGANTQTLDLYAIELDPDFTILQFSKVEKSINKWKRVNAKGSYLKKYGYFDYNYSEKINNDTYAFIYTDNEKLNSIYVSLKPNWVLGIITFIDGAFSTQKLNLSSKDVEITTERAKKGYILLRETNTKEKTTEIRLEKINY